MSDEMRIIIVEDELASRELIKDYFSRYAREANCSFDIISYESGVDFLNEYDGNGDIILMDIDLPGKSGMDVTRELRKRDKNIVVVFVTNLAQYAVEGYSVDAFDFIVKPVTYQNFSVKMKRAISRLKSRRDLKLEVVLSGGGTKIIKAQEIKYVEISNHTLCFHTVTGNYTSYGSMTELCKQLAAFPFELCNRCYLVNLRYVDGIKQYDVIVDGEALQISHLKRKEFMRKLNLYLSGDPLTDE